MIIDQAIKYKCCLLAFIYFAINNSYTDVVGGTAMIKHVLTKDLINTLRYKHRIEFTTETENKLCDLQNRFTEELFEAAIDPQNVIVLEENDILKTVDNYLKSVRVNLINCDDVFGRSSVNPFVHNLDLSRIMYSFNDRDFGVLERHPFPTTALQFANIKSTLLNRGENLDCDIYDLGIYGGRFITGVIEFALRFGFKVNKVVTCIARRRGIDRVKKRFGGLSMKFETLKVEFEQGWDELRDIIGLHGFLVDLNSSKILESGTNYAYIPYEEIISWFSLPLKNVKRFQDVCKIYRNEFNSLLAQEGLMLIIKPVGTHENLLIYSLKKF